MPIYTQVHIYASCKVLIYWFITVPPLICVTLFLCALCRFIMFHIIIMSDWVQELDMQHVHHVFFLICWLCVVQEICFFNISCCTCRFVMCKRERTMLNSISGLMYDVCHIRHIRHMYAIFAISPCTDVYHE